LLDANHANESPGSCGYSVRQVKNPRLSPQPGIPGSEYRVLNLMRCKLQAVMSIATAVILITPLSGYTGPLLKWTDENGRIHYGDRIPPKYAKQERKILNEQGIEVKTIDAAKTPEQLAE
jgi:hypothetical protein